MYDHAKRLAEKAQRAGIEADLYEWSGMIHDFQLAARILRRDVSPSVSLVIFYVATCPRSLMEIKYSFVEAGSTLRMMHGAFNREMKTTYHSYENLIIAAVDHAIKQNFNKVFFGPIMNETKRRMMREVEPCCVFFYSKNPFIRFFFPFIYSHSNLQTKELLAYSSARATFHES